MQDLKVQDQNKYFIGQKKYGPIKTQTGLLHAFFHFFINLLQCINDIFTPISSSNKTLHIFYSHHPNFLKRGQEKRITFWGEEVYNSTQKNVFIKSEFLKYDLKKNVGFWLYHRLCFDHGNTSLTLIYRTSDILRVTNRKFPAKKKEMITTFEYQLY